MLLVCVVSTLCNSKDNSLLSSSVHGVSQQEYWSRLSFPTPGDLPNTMIEPMSLVSPALAEGFFITAPPGKCLLGGARKDWVQEEKRVIEDETVGWHHRLNGQECEQTPGDSEEQGKPSMLQSMGSQRVGHDFVTKQQHLIVYMLKIPPFGNRGLLLVITHKQKLSLHRAEGKVNYKTFSKNNFMHFPHLSVI